MTATRMCPPEFRAAVQLADPTATVGAASGIAETKKLRSLLVLACLVCVLFGFSAIGFGQSVAGGLVGNVTDPSGAVVPDAKLTVKNQGTGAQLTGVTNQRGDFSLYPLLPGTYDLVVEREGFSTSNVTGIVIDVNTTVTNNVVLKVGSTSSEVTVTASAAPLITGSMSVESVVDQDQLEALPLKDRNYDDLVLLTPGSTENVSPGNGVNLDFGSYSLNGNRSFSNEYLVDGVPNNNTFQGRAATQMSVDAISEFKVISGVPTAEYGHASTAITSITKNGTNSFHGSLFDYYRGNALMAKSPFNNPDVTDTSAGHESLLRNQFGGSLGGPLNIPHVFDGQGKTFFFFDYEGLRQDKTVLRNSTVPTADFWKGDFSYLLSSQYCPDDPNKCIQLKDPFTTGRPNIPGNRLDLYKDGALINEIALKLRAYYPDPNRTGLANNSQLFPHEITNSDQFTGRIDRTLFNNQSLSARLTYHNADGFMPNVLATPGVGMTEPQNSRNANISWTTPVGNSAVNELRIGAMNFSDIVTYSSGDAPTVDSLGMLGFEQGNSGIPSLPKFSFTGDSFTSIKYGYSEGYGEAALSMTTNVFSIAETYSVNKGNHGFKLGFQGLRDYYNVLQQTTARGLLNFTGSKTSSSSTGYSFADFLIGVPSSTQQLPVKPKSYMTENEFAFFGQDTWRVRSNLTLELGVRYELSPSPTEAGNRLSMFTDKIPGGGFVVACDNGQMPLDTFLPSVMAKLTDANGNFIYPIACASQYGYNDRNLVRTGTNNWAPRVGFTWDPTKKGVYSVKGGYGVVYSRYPVQYFLQTMLVNPPFGGLFPYSQKINGVNASGGGTPTLTILSPYGGTGKATVNPYGIDMNFSLPNNQQWNLGVARTLGSKMMLAVSYVGNKGTHLFRTFNVNQRLVDPDTGVVYTTYSALFGTSNIPVRRSDGNSIYNAMVVEFRRRASKNVNFGANWTWAKSIDDVSTNVQSAGIDVLSPGRDRADSDYARRHTISIDSNYNLPVGKGRAFGKHMPGWAEAAVGGWTVSGIWHWSTGRFMTATMKSQGGLSNNRPDMVEGVNPNLPRDQRSPFMWFNPAAFAAVPDVDPVTGLPLIPRFGNAGRNNIIGPGINAADMRLRKSFRLGREKQRLSLEMSLFNVFNHPNWANPDTNISNTNTVGTISGLTKEMRLSQFAVRYDF